MKIAKWLFLAACAVLCCACSKNDPLAYVDEDADWVLYLNDTDILDHKLVKKIEKAAQNQGDYQQYQNELEKMLGVKLSECGAKAAIWGKFNQRTKPTDVKAVIVLDDDIADKLIEVIKMIAKEEELNCSEKTVDDCPAYIFEHVWERERYDYESGRYVTQTKTMTAFSVVKLDANVLQVFFEAEPKSIAKADNKSDLADTIDKDCVAALAISGKFINSNIKAKSGESTNCGDLLIMLFADNSEIKLEATLDISDIE